MVNENQLTNLLCSRETYSNSYIVKSQFESCKFIEMGFENQKMILIYVTEKNS